jgi:hypothetical protein
MLLISKVDRKICENGWMARKRFSRIFAKMSLLPKALSDAFMTGKFFKKCQSVCPIKVRNRPKAFRLVVAKVPDLSESVSLHFRENAGSFRRRFSVLSPMRRDSPKVLQARVRKSA